MTMPTLPIPEQAALLGCWIEAEGDPRQRMKFCRQAIGLGREAVKAGETLSLAQIDDIQRVLALAFRESKGTYNANASITKLAKWRMVHLGLESLPLLRQTRTKLIVANAACLAISDGILDDGWTEPHQAISAMNDGRYFVISMGADGTYSVSLRLVDADTPLLDPGEYKRVVEVSPVFRLKISSEKIHFGAAESVTEGVGFLVQNGDYHGSITSLRGARGRLKHVATVVRSDSPVAGFDQVPEFREY